MHANPAIKRFRKIFISFYESFEDLMTFTIKWPGQVHDARVLSNSGVFGKAEAGLLFPDVSLS